MLPDTENHLKRMTQKGSLGEYWGAWVSRNREISEKRKLGFFPEGKKKQENENSKKIKYR